VIRATHLSYRGQSLELTVPPGSLGGEAASAEDLADLFHAAHDRAFGRADPKEPVQVVSLRTSATRPAPPIVLLSEEAVPHDTALSASVTP